MDFVSIQILELIMVKHQFVLIDRLNEEFYPSQKPFENVFHSSEIFLLDYVEFYQATMKILSEMHYLVAYLNSLIIFNSSNLWDPLAFPLFPNAC